MIAGKRYDQSALGTLKDGVWTVKITVNEGNSEDLETWDMENFVCEAFAPSFEEAFALASNDVLSYLSTKIVLEAQKDESSDTEGEKVQ